MSFHTCPSAPSADLEAAEPNLEGTDRDLTEAISIGLEYIGENIDDLRKAVQSPLASLSTIAADRVILEPVCAKLVPMLKDTVSVGNKLLSWAIDCSMRKEDVITLVRQSLAVPEDPVYVNPEGKVYRKLLEKAMLSYKLDHESLREIGDNLVELTQTWTEATGILEGVKAKLGVRVVALEKTVEEISRARFQVQCIGGSFILVGISAAGLSLYAYFTGHSEIAVLVASISTVVGTILHHKENVFGTQHSGNLAELKNQLAKLQRLERDANKVLQVLRSIRDHLHVLADKILDGQEETKQLKLDVAKRGYMSGPDGEVVADQNLRKMFTVHLEEGPEEVKEYLQGLAAKPDQIKSLCATLLAEKKQIGDIVEKATLWETNAGSAYAAMITFSIVTFGTEAGTEFAKTGKFIRDTQ